MRIHLNFVTFVGGLFIGCSGLGMIGASIGTLAVAWELYRCRRLAILTAGISDEVILEFYRGDLSRRFYDAKSTAEEIRRFATQQHVAASLRGCDFISITDFSCRAQGRFLKRSHRAVPVC